MATLGFPIRPPNNLFSSDDKTIPYPAPSIFTAQFSFISLPHLIHSLTFYLPSPVHLYIYFPIFFRFNQHIVKLMRSSLVSPNVKGGQKPVFCEFLHKKSAFSSLFNRCFILTALKFLVSGLDFRSHRPAEAILRNKQCYKFRSRGKRDSGAYGSATY